MTEIKAKLIITHAGGQNTALFKTVEEAEDIRKQFVESWTRIKEYSNRDEDVIFTFSSFGSTHSIDLRKTFSIVVEDRDEWLLALEDINISELIRNESLRNRAKREGLEGELDKAEDKAKGRPVL